MLVFCTVLVVRLSAQERKQVERGMLDVCRTLAAALDRELLVTVGVLELLAQSSNLASGDLAAFHAEASRVVASRPGWTGVLLIAPDGTQLMNTIQPWGSPLGRINEPDSLAEVVRTAKPVVGSLVPGRITGQLAFPVRVPIVRGGSVTAVLTAAVRPDSLQDLLLTVFPVRDEWTRAFNDPVGTIAARSRDPERFVGTPGSSRFVQRITTVPEEFYRDTTVDGADVYVAFSRAPFSRWTAGMAFPASVVDGPLRRSLAITLGFGLALVALTGAGAYVVGRRIARPIRAATEAAQALTRGEPVRVVPSAVDEVAELGVALGRSADLLHRREAERDDLLAQAEAARRDAEAANRAKDEFLAMLGHELRNPIGAAMSAGGVLKQSSVGDDLARRALGVIDRQLAHLARLVDDLLDVGEVTARKIALVRTRLDLGEVARRVATTFEGSGRTEGRRLVIGCEPAWVDADAARVEQIVTNLLANALKFTRTGDTIQVRTATEGDEAVLRVSDTGAGIAPDMLPRVFDLFVQAAGPPDRSPGGLGVGLTLVRELVQLHGGAVSASSPGPRRGSTFVVRLPRADAPSIVAEATAAPPAVTKRVIVIVEDNADAREMLKVCLELAGHEVHETEDGPAGIEATRVHRPDVAIVDIGLPGVDGYEVARRIRAGTDHTTRLVALTGYGQPEDRRRALDAGFDAHLTKPVDPAELLSLIEALTRPRAAT
jgi:signal transduction histidine kinase/CheY-like chemotaxis protein